MKKWISLLLCLVMVLSIVPAAFAEEEPEDLTDEFEVIETADDSDEDIDAVNDPIEEDPDMLIDPIEYNPDGTINVDSKNFPDANFRKWVKDNISGGQSTMTQQTADNVVKIDCSSSNIAKLNGIAIFKNLQNLCCKDNKITSLDLSKNTKLAELDCTNNKLSKLTLTGCKELVKLNCTGNSIKTLNVTSCKKLKELYVSNNKLTTLNSDGVTTLEIVYASNNALASIGNLKNNKNLRALTVNNNKLKTIELTNLTKLETLYAASNSLTKIDLSKNTALKNLNLKSNKLKEIDLSKNTKLVKLDVSSNSLEKIDLTKNTDLQELIVSNNTIKKLDVSNNTDLTLLECASCGLSELDVSANMWIETLNADNNSLTKLDVSGLPLLKTLSVNSNKIKNLDLTGNTSLMRLSVNDNGLYTLDVQNLADLYEVSCKNNDLFELELNGCTDMEKVDCRNNKIWNLDISDCAKLHELYCQNNWISVLDPSTCPDLVKINCGDNRLSALRLDTNTKLTSATVSPQIVVDILDITESSGKYEYKMTDILPTSADTYYVKVDNNVYTYDKSTGIMIVPGQAIDGFPYAFETGAGDMQVEVKRSFNKDYNVAFKSSDVEYKGSTPYVVYDGTEHRPGFTVKDADGKTIPEYYYLYGYISNIDTGTAWLVVWMVGHSTTPTEKMFKIYFGPSEKLTVENVKDGIQLTWEPVEDAGGYVIYRRAWSSTTGGWTTFARWNYTTATSWKDTKVYAGSRYQYGVKAYKSDAFDNYNLGLVSPLKTTVRISTRTLTKLTKGSKSLTAEWDSNPIFTGYQLQYTTDSTFKKDVKTVKIDTWDQLKYKITNLKANTTYYVRVRSFHVFDGTTYYGEWSNVKNEKPNA